MTSRSQSGLVANYGLGVFPQGLRVTLPADGSAIAAWSIVTDSPSGLGGTVRSQTVASVAMPSAPFGSAQALTPAAGHFEFPAVAAAGGEAFVATAEPYGPVLIATRAPNASTFGAPRTLAAEGDGDVALAAGGAHLLAIYGRNDRLRLTVVR